MQVPLPNNLRSISEPRYLCSDRKYAHLRSRMLWDLLSTMSKDPERKDDPKAGNLGPPRRLGTAIRNPSQEQKQGSRGGWRRKEGGIWRNEKLNKSPQFLVFGDNAESWLDGVENRTLMEGHKTEVILFGCLELHTKGGDRYSIICLLSCRWCF